MRVVSNTSPLCNLAVIGRLELLRQRYGTVHIPPAVARELTALSHSGAKAGFFVDVKLERFILSQVRE